MESRQETEQKAEKGEGRRNNRTRQFITREQMESNDSPEIPDREGGDIRNARPPFGSIHLVFDCIITFRPSCEAPAFDTWV